MALFYLCVELKNWLFWNQLILQFRRFVHLKFSASVAAQIKSITIMASIETKKIVNVWVHWKPFGTKLSDVQPRKLKLVYQKELHILDEVVHVASKSQHSITKQNKTQFIHERLKFWNFWKKWGTCRLSNIWFELMGKKCVLQLAVKVSKYYQDHENSYIEKGLAWLAAVERRGDASSGVGSPSNATRSPLKKINFQENWLSTQRATKLLSNKCQYTCPVRFHGRDPTMICFIHLQRQWNCQCESSFVVDLLKFHVRCLLKTTFLIVYL